MIVIICIITALCLIYKFSVVSKELEMRERICGCIIKRLRIDDVGGKYFANKILDEEDYLWNLISNNDVELNVTSNGKITVSGLSDIETNGNVSRIKRDKDIITLIVMGDKVTISTKSKTSRSATEVTVVKNDLLQCLYQQGVINRGR